MKKDEKELQQKLRKSLPKSFDEQFWKRYKDEIPQTESSIGFGLPLSGFAVACLVLFFIFNTNTEFDRSDMDMVALVDDVEMYENIDMLSDVNYDIITLNDEEWDELLNTI